MEIFINVFFSFYFMAESMTEKVKRLMKKRDKIRNIAIAAHIDKEIS